MSDRSQPIASYPVTTVDILRHGQCKGGEILRGTTNSSLSARGWQQMQTALKPHCGWQRVISSPLLRCRAFAEAFAREHHLPITTATDLRELDFGDWDGLNADDIERRNPTLAEAYYRNPEQITPPGGESLAAAHKRMTATLQHLLEDYQGEHLLLVVHGGTIRLLLSSLLSTPLNRSQIFAVPPGCLTRVTVCHTPEGHYPQLVFHQPEAV
jgi:alpha-ribazole phosphatase